MPHLPTRIVVGTIGLALITASLTVAVPTASGPATPARFGDLVRVGMTDETVRRAEANEWILPRAQVYYTSYQYAVGYYGIESLVGTLQDLRHRRQFGRPLVVYVTTIDPNVELTERGYIRESDTPGRTWARATASRFVVGSAARTPSGPAVVAFDTPREARVFAERYGGRVVRWRTLRRINVQTQALDRAAWQNTLADRRGWANQTVRETASLRHRQVSIVVGRDVPTLQEAIAAAPPNTTVRLPPGRYEVSNLSIRKPLTIQGIGNATRIIGDGNGTVLTIHASRSAVLDLRLSGIGTDTSGDVANATDWEETVRLAYAVADAGIRFVDANNSLVSDVTIRTPTNGVVFIDSDGSVISNATIFGEMPPFDGFMSALAFRSRTVVQNSTFVGGRDAVYTHRAHGLVIRHNRMRALRFGIHEMYTSRALVADNRIRNTTIGIIVMSRPTGNAVVGNDVRNSEQGIGVAGSHSLIADNVLVANEMGFQTAGTESLYVANLIARNEIGVREGTILPTNRVVGNAFVANKRHVERGQVGPLQVWAASGRGNFWSGIPGTDRDLDGLIERPYKPTSPIDRAAHSHAGAAVLAHSPALAGLRALIAAVPSLRETGVLDPAPLVAPPRRSALAGSANSADPRSPGVGPLFWTTPVFGAIITWAMWRAVQTRGWIR